MDRVLLGTPHAASVTFYQDDTAADPGVVTVTLTRDDGTVIASAQGTSGSGAAARTFNLTTVHTATLDRIALAWTSASLGVLTTWVEVVGGFLFELSTARKTSPLTNTTTYPTADLMNARTLAECALEDACGVAFVPRYGRELVDGPGDTDVLLKRPNPRTVTVAKDTGLTVDPATLVLYDTGVVYNPAKWKAGRKTVSLSYTHGFTFAPGRVSRACLLLAKRFLVDTPISDRATMLQNQDGTTEYLVTAGVREAVFDVPECNAVVTEYGMRFGIA